MRFPVLFHVGEITQEREFSHSRSPLMNRKMLLFFNTPWNAHFGVWALGHDDDNIVGGVSSVTPYYMYIYSLGHFLTTKGALIDGDGYPPKNPKNDPKMTPKNTQIWSKMRSKKGQKMQFLMAKSSFSSFSLKWTQKLTKNHQKLIINLGVKMRWNLTTKRGDSGSAGLLE